MTKREKKINRLYHLCVYGKCVDQGAVGIYQLYQLVFMALTMFVLISCVFCLVLHCDHVSSFLLYLQITLCIVTPKRSDHI
ncbi:hypothetical protein BP00DRAFT_76185 [Aspergillus indologenus CBS 114.80]|uniref:Uncharacterized protein n=1 Tax=Aspergillus indologenus CBS 114.80 TaxID=1450541 RepID=A0A2V5ICC4_9EURO|nr:hypothetical protein BP00DRAFT_76185 [Aspergillus indologenus CBS 114.80]